jgi:hypothetical protein
MTQIDKVKAIPIDTQIKNFISLFDALSNQEEGVYFISNCQRIQTVIEFVYKIINEKNIELIPLQAITNINTHITNINNNLTHYQGNKNQSFLDTANKEADSIITILPSILFPYTVLEYGSIESGIDNVIKQVENFDIFIKHQTNKIDNDIQTNKSQLETIKAEITKTNSIIDQQKIRLDSTIQTTLTEFNNEQKKRENIYNTQISSIKKEAETVSKTISDKNEEKMKELTLASTEIINKLEEKKKQASDLVKIISNITVTGNFNKYAEYQKNNANILRVIAIIFMVILAGGAIWIIFSINPNDFDWKVTLIRLLATSILTVPSAYAARESSKHRKLEMKYRKMELELASIDPFMENLPEKDRFELKHNMVDRMFGKEEAHYEAKDESVQTSNLIDLLREAIKTRGNR